MFLEKIYARRREVIEKLKEEEPIVALERQVSGMKKDGYSLKERLYTEKGMGVIAEVKRASPSKGILNANLDSVKLVKQYERGGAVGISVLTEPDFFKGSYGDLEDVRKAVKLPILNKDFLYDPWQVYKAKTIGADVVLLIATMLEQGQLRSLYEEALALELEVLIETHDEQDLEKVLRCEKAIIGINNRDLRSFQIDLDTTLRLSKLIPEDYLVISESGMHTEADVKRLEGTVVRGILVGESLVKAEDSVAQLMRLRGAYA
ncbi:MAG: indole-3-glycerol phosphate synthase TrpC [Cellulosilyticaceae bacterium]